MVEAAGSNDHLTPPRYCELHPTAPLELVP